MEVMPFRFVVCDIVLARKRLMRFSSNQTWENVPKSCAVPNASSVDP